MFACLETSCQGAMDFTLNLIPRNPTHSETEGPLWVHRDDSTCPRRRQLFSKAMIRALPRARLA